MLRKLTLSLSALGLAAGVYAAPLTPEQAMQRAQASGPAKVKSSFISGMQLVKTAKASNGATTAYIFADSSRPGFAILSADDMAVPVLGYSDTGAIDPDNMPPSLQWWLNMLAAHAQYAESRGNAPAAVRPYAPAECAPIAPLLTTTWNQDAPYNLLTPVINDVQTPTGCLATAFAQVMKYFNYPESGQGSITYMSNGKKLTMNFGNTRFKWDQMQDSYPMTGYDETQAKAVATLMKACGYSVEMSYTTTSSGAVGFNLAKAAKEYFKYDEGTYYTLREFYSYDQWFSMIYDNLKNVGPVAYDGISVDGGHAFVCDGYDGNGYFHFNWGWGGLSDGYYVLDSLNPDSQGIGGAEGGFNFDQGATFGMKPAMEGSTPHLANMRIYGSVSATLSGSTLTFTTNGAGFGNASYRKIYVQPGVIVTDASTGALVQEVAGKLGTLSTVTLAASGYYPSANPNVVLPSLPDGNYKVTLATKDLEVTDAPWQPMICRWGDANYCLLSVQGGAMTVTNVAADVLDFESAAFDSPLYKGRLAKLVCTVKNDTEKQLSCCFTPALYRNGAMQYIGDVMMVTVNAGEEAQTSGLVRFYEADSATSTGVGTYQLVLIDRETNQPLGVYGEYEMKTVSTTLTVECDEFKIEDAPVTTMTLDGKTYEDVYVISDASHFNAMLKYTVTSGYFDSDLRLIGSKYDAATGKFVNFDEDLYCERPYDGEGDTEVLVVPLDYSGLELSGLYKIVSGYKVSSKTKGLGTLYLTFDASGIENVMDNMEEACAEYFNLQGMPITNPQRGQVLIRRTAAKAEKIRY